MLVWNMFSNNCYSNKKHSWDSKGRKWRTLRFDFSINMNVNLIIFLINVFIIVFVLTDANSSYNRMVTSLPDNLITHVVFNTCLSVLSFQLNSTSSGNQLIHRFSSSPPPWPTVPCKCQDSTHQNVTGMCVQSQYDDVFVVFVICLNS